MQQSTAILHWRFPGGTITGTSKSHTFTADDTIWKTGAQWMGTHGVVLELAKITFFWNLLFPVGAEEQQTQPGGWVKQGDRLNGLFDKKAYLQYIASVCIGDTPDRVNKDRDVDLRSSVAESKVVNMGNVPASNLTTISSMTVITEWQNMEWDFTDGAGNGLLIAAPALVVGGQCYFGMDTVNRDTYAEKWMVPPYGLCDGVGQGHPKTFVHFVYKYRQVDLHTWTHLTMNQSQKQAPLL